MKNIEKNKSDWIDRVHKLAWQLLPSIQEYIATHQEEYQAFLSERAAKAETQRKNGTERAAKSGERE
mgnify:CR=1 FL=1